jgi:hypothetical protein
MTTQRNKQCKSLTENFFGGKGPSSIIDRYTGTYQLLRNDKGCRQSLPSGVNIPKYNVLMYKEIKPEIQSFGLYTVLPVFIHSTFILAHN